MAVQNVVVQNALHGHGATKLILFTGPKPPEGDEEWWPGYPDINQMWRHPAFTVQRDQPVGSGGDYVRGSTTYVYPRFLDPQVGNGVTTPDPGVLPNSFVVVQTVRYGDSSGFPAAAAQIETADPRSYMIYRTPINNRWYMERTADGVWANRTSVFAAGDTPVIGIDQTTALAVTQNSAGRTILTPWVQDPSGKWTAFSAQDAGAASTAFDVTTPLRVGSGFPVLPGARIYSVEMRTGLDPTAGAVLWRFDASEYPGTGTSYVDPRGRTWTLTSATAIAPAASGPNLPQTAVRYPIGSDIVAAEVAAGRGVLYTRPFDYNTVEIFWGIPGKVFDSWAEIAIVRSAFGYPATVNDGQTIFRNYRTVMFPVGVPEEFTAPALYDMRDPRKGAGPSLTSGRYYYYSLFFRINLEWVRSFTSATLLPRNFGHSEHLWNNLPPYYQWVDNQQREQDGDLRRFLRIFGFELDQTREFVEQWQELYHVDYCPQPLLKRLGPNFGVPFESGIGEIRYRSLLAEIGRLYGIRGTRPCLELVCEAASKYECDVTQTGNLMTMPDDSDFFEGTGNWAGQNPALDATTTLGSASTVLAPVKVFFKSNKLVPAPVGYGRGVMEVWTTEADELTDVLINCGCGISYDVYQGKDEDGNDIVPYGARYIYPIQVGVLADNAGVYSFSVQVKMETPYAVDVMILWFDTNGAATTTSYKGRTASVTAAPGDTNWREYQAVGTPPVGAVYAVPAILLDRSGTSGGTTTGSKSPSVFFAAAAMYLLGSANRVSSEGPDNYLEMGRDYKRMGLPTPTPPVTVPPIPTPYPGYQIGEKKS